jgi:hypothetical protein
VAEVGLDVVPMEVAFLEGGYESVVIVFRQSHDSLMLLVHLIRVIFVQKPDPPPPPTYSQS